MAAPNVLNLSNVAVTVTFKPPPKDMTLKADICSAFNGLAEWMGSPVCKSVDKPAKPTTTTIPALPRGSANATFAPVTVPSGVNSAFPTMFASALSPGYAGGLRTDMTAGQWFVDNTRVKDVGMLQYVDSGNVQYIVFFPPIAGQPLLSSILSWGPATLPSVGSTVSGIVGTAVTSAQAAAQAADAGGGGAQSAVETTAVHAWNASSMQVTLSGTTVATTPVKSDATDDAFAQLPVAKDGTVTIGASGSMLFGGGSADIPVAMWVTAGTIPETQVDVIVWSSPSKAGDASSSRVTTAYATANTAAGKVPFAVAKWVNTHHLVSMLPSTAAALTTGGQPTSHCDDTSTPPPQGVACSSFKQLDTCLYTPYALTSEQGTPCSLYNTKKYGKYCRAQAATRGAAGDADVEKACAECVDGSGTGACGSQCPAVCTALHPQCATSLMYTAGSGGSSSFPMQFTPGGFAKAFVASGSGAFPTDIKVRRGTTPTAAAAAVQQGLLDNLECWWPEAVAAAQDVAAAKDGTRFASGGGMACNGLLLTSKLRAKYGKAASTCPASVNGMPVNCGTLVAKAMADAVTHGADGTKMTQMQAWLLTKACGIDAGVAEPPGLPHERKWPLIIGLGFAGLGVVLLVVAIAVRLVRHHRAKHARGATKRA